MRRVVVRDWQKLERQDIENLTSFPQAHSDHIVRDFLADGFEGFNIAAPVGATEITIGAGRLWRNGIGYYNDDEGGVDKDLITMIPQTTRRIVTVGVWGQEIPADTEPRTFLTDATTRATVARQESTELRRRAEVSIYRGEEGPDPIAAEPPANVTPIADILLDSGGVISVTYRNQNRVPNLRDLNARQIASEAWQARAGSRLDTLGTDVSALAIALRDKASLNLVLQLAGDMAEVREKLEIPDDYTAWDIDHFLETDDSDTDHPDFNARIEDGARFAHANQRVAPLALANPLDARVVVQGDFALPAYTEVPRISTLGRDAEMSISQYSHQTVIYTRLRRARWRIRWGWPFRKSRSWLWYHKRPYYWEVRGNRVLVFRKAEVVQIVDWDHWTRHYWGHRRKWFWIDKWVKVYWKHTINTGNVNGSIFAQTFLNSQTGWLTSLDLMFTRRAAAGDVRILLTEVTESQAPKMDEVVAEANLPVASINLYPAITRIPFQPTQLEAGKRYAIVVSTPGNHFVAMTLNNKFAQGTFFTSTDQAWFQGDLTRDLAFRLNFARFNTNRTEVQLTALELAGGIAAIDVLAEMVAPEGTAITWEVQLGGIWTPIVDPDSDEAPEHPLVGLPALLNFRAVLTGTADNMPGFGLGDNSEVETWRPRLDFCHISEERLIESGTINTVDLKFRVENWRGAPLVDPAEHTIAVAVLVGAGYTTVETPDVVSIDPAPDDDDAVIVHATFTLAAPVSAYKIRVQMTATSALSTPNLGERVDVALTV